VRAAPDAYPIMKRLNLALDSASPEEMDELEAGRSACGLG
jgi:hypothetical protein